jgi:hypothetical protein
MLCDVSHSKAFPSENGHGATCSSLCWDGRNKELSHLNPGAQHEDTYIPELFRFNEMWQYNPQNPHKPIWINAPEPSLSFTDSPSPELKTGSLTKNFGNMLNDVERALNHAKMTLGDLDQVLSGVEQRLINMEESLNSNQPITNRERFHAIGGLLL